MVQESRGRLLLGLCLRVFACELFPPRSRPSMITVALGQLDAELELEHWPAECPRVSRHTVSHSGRMTWLVRAVGQGPGREPSCGSSCGLLGRSNPGPHS
jgi:hypothetical protein